MNSFGTLECYRYRILLQNVPRNVSDQEKYVPENISLHQSSCTAFLHRKLVVHQMGKLVKGTKFGL